ncbi:hypothetical protein OG478_00555 [Streptomyces phaeochromogenes]|uniref:hypothetical protein n=1 Tax=Streptomyces phaeochromogenes TaxID=1923 RepID=UPI003869DA22|nr:hypothetical protein OG478_00555 [Streptomyces phaeochromogenes]
MGDEPSKCGIYIKAESEEAPESADGGGGSDPTKCGINLAADEAPEGVIAHAGSTGTGSAAAASSDPVDKCGIYIAAE